MTGFGIIVYLCIILACVAVAVFVFNGDLSGNLVGFFIDLTDKGGDRRNSIPETRAVRPVRPPAATPMRVPRVSKRSTNKNENMMTTKSRGLMELQSALKH